MKRFLAAFRFFTVIPVPGTLGTGEEDLAGCVPYIPVVGLLIGAMAGLAGWALPIVAPPAVASALLIALLIRISGGLHMDGLADTADGFYGTRRKERILEIMKDSRIGSMGAVAIGLALLLKFAGLTSMSAEHLWRVAVLMPLAGRCLIVVQLAVLPYARSEGLATLFYRRSHRWDALWAILVLIVASYLLLQWHGVIAAGVCLLGALLFCRLCRSKIGGATGDTFGALCEIGETLMVLSLTFRW